MKKGFSYLSLCIALLFAIGLVFAREPKNLSLIKQDLIRYHDSGAYLKDTKHVINKAKCYLKYRLAHPNGKKPAIVFDIDETSLINYPSLIQGNLCQNADFVRPDEKIKQGYEDTAIHPTLMLYHYAKASNVAVFFITGRPSSLRKKTIENLEQAGYKNWNGLFFKPDNYKSKSISDFKIAIRKQLTEQGYDIILNIGDQKSDLVGGYADKGFKLPNPYYLVP